MSRSLYGMSVSAVITHDVHVFLQQFLKNVKRGSAGLLYQSYTQFHTITDNTYQVSRWPSSLDVVQDLKLNPSDPSTSIFLYLYRELYYRHAFDRCDIDYKFMHSSFQNYINLFNTLLAYYDENRKFPEIPTVWLWDMIHSFVSQFQYYHHWKQNPSDNYKNHYLLINTFQNTNQQQSITQKWNVQFVLRYLHYFVGTAKIPIRYNTPPAGTTTTAAAAPNTKPTTKSSIMMQMLGFFSLIGLCRIHTLLADYRTAIDVVKSVDLKTKSAITRIPSCAISAHYYLSFAYMMTRNFADAHSMLCTLLSNNRYADKGGNRKFYFNDDDKQISSMSSSKRKTDGGDAELSDKDKYQASYLSMDAMIDSSYALLAICQTQTPIKLNEMELGRTLQENFGNEIEDINDITCNIDRKKQSYIKLFRTCSPDFINVHNGFKYEKLAQLTATQLCNNQYKSFMRLVSGRHNMMKVKNEIKLFRVIPVNKLAVTMYSNTTATDDNDNDNDNKDGGGGGGGGDMMMNDDNDDYNVSKLNRELIRLKWRMKQNKNTDAWGRNQDDNNQFDFFIKNNCVYVTEVQTSQLWKYSDVFIRDIQKVTEWLDTANY